MLLLLLNAALILLLVVVQASRSGFVRCRWKQRGEAAAANRGEACHAQCNSRCPCCGVVIASRNMRFCDVCQRMSVRTAYCGRSTDFMILRVCLFLK